MKFTSIHLRCTLYLLFCIIVGNLQAADDIIRVNMKKYKNVTPVQYGFHYEEIGMLGEGGLHAELIRNRGFEESNLPRGLAIKDGLYEAVNPTGNNKNIFQVDPLIGWFVSPESYSPIKISRTDREPLNEQNPHSMLVNVTPDFQEGMNKTAIYNKGFFGMNFVSGNEYRLTFYAKSNANNTAIKVTLTDEHGKSISAENECSFEGRDWKKFNLTLVANADCQRGMLAIIPEKTGRFQLDMVSMYPSDTWDNGKSIFRKDITQNLVDYHPDFLRFPGGCVVHGVNEQTMYHWKETIGDMAKRPGAWSKWAPYYRTDGLGYHEFYELCEYIQADAMYVTPTGMVCTEWAESTGKHTFKQLDVDINYYINDALDAIEYAIGSTDTKWGSERSKNGHPAPFPLKYVEIGNEDFGPVYYERYEKIANAIRSKYPQIIIIANAIIFPDEQDKRKYIADFPNPENVKIFDEHYYQNIDWAKKAHYKMDAYDRKGPDIFIGELGINGQYPKNLLAEGVVKLQVERNGDLRPLMADRPLMRNYDFMAGGRMCPVFLHNSSKSVKTFNYYMCKMLRDNKIDRFYDLKIEQQENVFVTAGRDPETKELVLKIINLDEEEKSVKLEISGLKKSENVSVTELTANRDQMNTPLNPEAVTPKLTIRKISFPASETLPANSFRVYRFK